MISVLFLIYLIVTKPTNFSRKEINGCFLMALGNSV